jgi:serine protease
VAGSLLVKFEARLDGARAVLKALGPSGLRIAYERPLFGTWHAVKVQDADGRGLEGPPLDEALRAVKRTPGVLAVEKNHVAHPQAVPNDPYFSTHQSWHYWMASLPQAWDVTTGSSNIVVAVLDDGITPHPDFGTRLLPGYDFVTDVAGAADGDSRDADPLRPAIFPDGHVSFHGTHVAGTIGAKSNNGVGAAGADWEAQLLPVRVLGVEGGSRIDIIDGMRWAAGLSVPGVPANTTPAKVLNMSLGGGGGKSLAYQDAIDEINQLGKIIVVAAGNSNVDASQFAPASQDGVITVGAVGLDGRRSSYSNYGTALDLVAPGGDFEDLDSNGREDQIFSLFATATGAPSYGGSNGTSMAAPHVAGIVALMASVNGTLDHSQAEAILRQTALAQYTCAEGCGSGLVDAYSAVQLASGVAAAIGPRLLVTPAALELGAATSASVEVNNVGAVDLHFTLYARGMYGPRSGITMQTGTVVSQQKQVVTFNIDRANLADGIYRFTLRFESDGGTQEVPVSFRVGPRPSPALEVVALQVNAAGGVTAVASTIAQEASGWAWSLSVPPGVYFLGAGTDDDNNGYLGDPGEHLGLWPNLTDPQPFVAYSQQVISGLNFPTSLQLVVPTPGAGQFAGSCADNAECASLLCLSDGAGGGRCTQGCAATSDCPAGYFCGHGHSTLTGEGVDVCMETLARGAECKRAEECTSGTCFDGFVTDTCEQTCQSAADCPSPDTCSGRYDASLNEILVCQEPRPLGSSCTSPDQCDRPAALGGQASCATDAPSGVCTQLCSWGCPAGTTCAAMDYDGNGSTEYEVCLASCSTQADCRGGFMCRQQASGDKACVPERDQACSSSFDCWSEQFCDATAGFCRDAYVTSFVIKNLQVILDSSTDEGAGDPADSYAWVVNSLVTVSTTEQSNTSTPSWPTAFTVAVPVGEALTINFTDVDALSSDDFIGSVEVTDWASAVRNGYFLASSAAGPITYIRFDITPAP